MSVLTPVLPTLKRLIPRLAPSFDGEVVSTARAINRTLAAKGLDWHDVVGALSPAGTHSLPFASPPRPETWRGIADWCARHSAASLDEREMSFVLDMARRLGRFREPSAKQAAWLGAIYVKLGGPE